MNSLLKFSVWAIGCIGCCTAAFAAPGNGILTIHDSPANPGQPMVQHAAAKPVKGQQPAATGRNSGVAASPERSSPTEKQIKVWIKELDSQRYVQRARAKKHLIAAGDMVRADIHKEMAGLTTPEMRHEMRAVLHALNNLRLLRGKLITLDLKDASAAQAFKKIGRAAGVTFNQWPPQLFQQAAGHVTLHAHHEPLLRVLWSVARQTNISMSNMNFNNMFNVIAANGSMNAHNPVDFEGAFLTEITEIDYHKMLIFNTSRPQSTKQLMVSMTLVSDPTLRILDPVNQATVTEATDDLGHSLVIPANPGPNVYYGYWGNMGTVYNLTVNLHTVKGMGTKLKVLKGSVPVVAGAQEKTIIFKHLHKAQHQDIAGIRISVANFTLLNQNQYQVQVSFGPRTPPVNNSLSPDQQAIVQSLENSGNYTLTDAKGRSIVGNMQGGGGGPTQFQYNFGFFNNNNNNNVIGKPTKLVITVVTRQKIIHVPFEFRNVPLP